MMKQTFDIEIFDTTANGITQWIWRVARPDGSTVFWGSAPTEKKANKRAHNARRMAADLG